MSELAEPQASDLDFTDHAREVTRAVRGTFASLLSAAGANPSDMQSIVQHVGVNRNLAWKLSKIAKTDDPATIIKQIPGPAGLKIFLSRVEKARPDAKLLERARDAIDAYNKLIKLHSGDRETLAMMGNDLSPASSRKQDEQHRKQLFQGTSYVWGAKARIHWKLNVFGPAAGQPDSSGRSTLLDVVAASGLIDFRRLRPDVRWTMALRRRVHLGAANPIPGESLDPLSNDPEAAPLVTAFCSKPLPVLHRFTDGEINKFELVEGRVGNTGAIDCVVGTIHRGIPLGAIPGTDWGGSIFTSDTPAESMVIDYMVHESVDYALKPQIELHGQLSPVYPPTERSRLPLSETLETLGRDPRVLPASEIPRHGELIDYMFNRTGWNPSEFFAYRLRIAYPAVPAFVVFKYPLP